LHGLSLLAEAGDCLAVIGPNGGGKTTMLRVICRSLRATAGKVILGGQDAAVLSQAAVARMIGLVPQTAAGAGFEFTVEEVVLMGRYPHLTGLRRPGRADGILAEEAMRATGVFPLRDRLLGELSGGEAQRVYIARSIAQQPRMLLLDEPTAHLDLGYQAEIMQLLRQLNDGGRGLTIIAVLHDLNLAVQFFERFVVIADGQVAAAGGPETMQSDLLSRIYRAPVRVERDLAGSITRVYAEVGKGED
jgi:iron complex transport system ATP-binding protein